MDYKSLIEKEIEYLRKIPTERINEVATRVAAMINIDLAPFSILDCVSFNLSKANIAPPNATIDREVYINHVNDGNLVY